MGIWYWQIASVWNELGIIIAFQGNEVTCNIKRYQGAFYFLAPLHDQWTCTSLN